jgi:hypothetical protein
LYYQINTKVKIFMQTGLPLLKDREFVADIYNNALVVISSGSGTGERSLGGRGVVNPEEKV